MQMKRQTVRSSLIWVCTDCPYIRIIIIFKVPCIAYLENEPRHEKTGFLAHLSRRLIGELIVYQWSGVRRPSIVRRPQCSKIFFSETAGPIKAKFYVEPPWVGGMIFCSRHLGPMTKMAATPIW